MADEDSDRAAREFLLVQSFEAEIDDQELLAIANFWTGRCLRKTGRYDDALKTAVSIRESIANGLKTLVIRCHRRELRRLAAFRQRVGRLRCCAAHVWLGRMRSTHR